MSQVDFRYLTQGRLLQELRLKHNLSQHQLAQAAQISLSTLVKLESGERVPGKEIREALAGALGVSNLEIETINWPTPYATRNYNHRQPTNAPKGSGGDTLKRIRLKKGLTQAEVARKLEVTEQAYARLERGYTRQPDAKLISRLVQILGQAVADINFSTPSSSGDKVSG